MKQITLKNLRQHDHRIDEAYRNLRTGILFSTLDTKVISITSCDPNDGKSTSAFELSKSLAEAGKKILFIDADMRKSRFSIRHTEEPDIEGLSHFLSGQSQIADVLYSTNISGLYVVFSGVFPPNPAELLSSTVFSEFVAEAKQNFDFVIIDTPPIGLVSDAAVCVANSDAAIIVLNSGKTKIKKAKEAKAAIESIGTKILGCILNNVKSPKKKGYYSYY